MVAPETIEIVSLLLDKKLQVPYLNRYEMLITDFNSLFIKETLQYCSAEIGAKIIIIIKKMVRSGVCIDKKGINRAYRKK